jgi:hypothetical protein
MHHDFSSLAIGELSPLFAIAAFSAQLCKSGFSDAARQPRPQQTPLPRFPGIS